jgi:protein TonB
MAHDLFDDVVDPSVHVGTHPWYSVPLSIVAHVFLVGTLMIVPFVGSSVFPTPETVLAFAPPPVTPLPPPGVEVAPVPAALMTTILRPDAAPIEAPDRFTEAPPTIATLTHPAAPSLLVSASADVTLVPPTAAVAVAMPEPPAAAAPIRVGGEVREPRKVHHVAPVYPSIARAARREGTVVLEVTIARNGSVGSARVLRSADIFDQAALDAVRLWRYTATTLNGVPVDVTMTVTVRFTLN